MSKLIKIFLVLVSVFTGITFLYSAYTKLIPIQSFEYTMVEFAHLPWTLAAIAARFIIGLEAALGAMLLFNIFGRRRWVLKTALGLTMLFSGYLIYLWISRGDNVNCGCFGDAIWMSPSASLIKNAIIIIALTFVHRFYNGLIFRYSNLVSIFVSIIIIILPYILFALPDQQPTWLSKDKFELDVTPLYDTTTSRPIPNIELKKGKYVIAFFSLKCPHCRMAARKMQIMKEKNPALPFFFVIAGKDKDVPGFWKETNAEAVPHTKLDGDKFTAMIGYSWPVIYFLNNGVVEASTNYISLNQGEIERWLAQP